MPKPYKRVILLAGTLLVAVAALYIFFDVSSEPFDFGFVPGGYTGNILRDDMAGMEKYRSYVSNENYGEWRDAYRVKDPDGIRIFVGERPLYVTGIQLELLSPSVDPIVFRVLDEDIEIFRKEIQPIDSLWYETEFSLPKYAYATLSLHSKSEFSIGKLEIQTNDEQPTGQPDVFIIMIDTLRTDHLGAYGYDRPTSPNIDAFSKDSVLFTNFMTQTSWTRTSVASLLTSTYPNVHGALDRGDVVRESDSWISQILSDHAYETAGLITNPNCLPLWGFGDGFRKFIDQDSKNWFNSDDRHVLDKSKSLLEISGSQPHFQYVHTLSPHSPYVPPEPFRGQFAKMKPNSKFTTDPTNQEKINLYDAEIAYLDSLLGDYFDFLKAQKRYDSSMIILISDHGEEFWDHGGTSHGKTLFNEQLNVPLIVKFPKNEFANQHYTELVESVDIAPTILDVLDIESPFALQGESILPGLTDNQPIRDIAYSSLRLNQFSLESAQSKEWKLTMDLHSGQNQWFDLVNDPKEQKPILQSPLDPDPLWAHIQSMTLMGQAGLHILLTHDSKEEIKIDGVVKGIDSFSLLYPEELTRTSIEDGQLDFTITMPEAENPYLASTKWQRILKDPTEKHIIERKNPDFHMTEMDFAEFVIPAMVEDEIAISLRVNDQKMSNLLIHTGKKGTHPSDHKFAGRPIQWISNPLEFALESLPRRFGVYVWYVPTVDEINDSEIDPELEEALRGLGYIN
jgi:arylsulfatase A-like enzyme